MTTGLGTRTRFTREAYMMVIRMLADNYKYTQIVRAIHERFPDHRPDGETPITYRMVWHLSHQREDEVQQMREELNKNLTDLWIANKRQRLVALQDIYTDANRWVPKRVIEPPRGPGRRSKEEMEEKFKRGVPKALVVFEKDTPTMLAALKQAREELGVTAADRIADSITDLVRQAEEQRGLEITAEASDRPKDAVDYLQEARLIELPSPSRSKGADAKRGFLDGDAPMLGEDATRELVGEPLLEAPPTSEKSTPTSDTE